jgi:hypothetical protein
MLKQATKDKLKTFGLDPDKLIEAITATEEKDFEIPEDITVIKTADLETRDTNKLTEGKRLGEAEGEKKGKELAAKAFKKKFALEDAVPAGDIDKIVEAVNTKLNKGDAALQEQVQGLLKDKETLTAQILQEKETARKASFDSSLISMFPAGRTTDLTDSERLALVKMNLEFAEDNGKTVVKRNGQIITDKNTHAPVEIKQVISDLFAEKKWVGTTPAAGGRGGDNNNNSGGTSAGIKKASQFEEKWKAENPGKNTLSSEYTESLNKHAKEVTDFDMYN